MSLDAVLVNNRNAHHSSRAGVEVYARLDSGLHKLDTLVHGHAGLVVLPHVASDIWRSGASDGAGRARHHPAQRNVVHLTAALRIPASDDDPGNHVLTVLIAVIADLAGGPVDFGWLADAKFAVLQQTGHMIGDGLGVGGASAAATVYLVREAG